MDYFATKVVIFVGYCTPTGRKGFLILHAGNALINQCNQCINSELACRSLRLSPLTPWGENPAPPVLNSYYLSSPRAATKRQQEAAPPEVTPRPARLCSRAT